MQIGIFGRYLARVHTQHLLINLLGRFSKTHHKFHIHHLHSSTVTISVCHDNAIHGYVH
jgi:hypothetical protein